MGYVYKITNNINGKVYIGITTYVNPIDRFTKHLADYKTAKLLSKRPLYEAFEKYGVENFSFVVIEEVDNALLGLRETYWITYYNSYIKFKNSNGYNATLGGDGGHNVLLQQEKLYILELYDKYHSIRKVSKLTKHKGTLIAKILREYGYNYKDYAAKKLVQIDKKTNKILNIFNSISDANCFLGKPFNDGHIGEVCNKKRKTAYGYKWKFIE